MIGRLSTPDWVETLRAASRRTLQTGFGPDAGEFVRTFSDELGHRRAVDAPLLAWTTGTELNRQQPTVPESADVSLWWALLGPADHSSRWLTAGASAPLIAHAPEQPIEVWTESELCALHAAWHHARRNSDGALRERCLNAAAWHVQHMQPDNATNHPWAIHVFIILRDARNDSAADLYAQTLLHNCQVALGKPDRFSACVVMDAADALQRFVGEDPGPI